MAILTASLDAVSNKAAYKEGLRGAPVGAIMTPCRLFKWRVRSSHAGTRCRAFKCKMFRRLAALALALTLAHIH
jgi:hypothetical protein